jgi:hypothetical protein
MTRKTDHLILQVFVFNFYKITVLRGALNILGIKQKESFNNIAIHQNR